MACRLNKKTRYANLLLLDLVWHPADRAADEDGN